MRAVYPSLATGSKCASQRLDPAGWLTYTSRFLVPRVAGSYTLLGHPPCNMLKHLKTVLKVVLGVGILAYICMGIDPDQLLALARQGKPAHLALGVGSLLVAMFYFQWSRLHLLIKGYTDGIPVSLKIFYVGALFNNLLPSNIGGDAIRLMYLKALRPGSWGAPFMLLFIYRSSGFVLLVLAGLIYIVVEHDRLIGLLAAQHVLLELQPLTWFAIVAGVAVVLSAAAWVVRRMSARLRERIVGFLNNCRVGLAQLSPGDAIRLAIHTVLFHGFRLLSFYYLVLYLGQRVAPWDLVFVISATAVIAVAPVTVAGLGVTEGSITLLLGMYGVAQSSAVAIALVNRAVMLMLAAIGGVVYMSSRNDAVRSPPAAESP
jgi:glycosyltransferase 2 family protein